MFASNILKQASKKKHDDCCANQDACSPPTAVAVSPSDEPSPEIPQISKSGQKFKVIPVDGNQKSGSNSPVEGQVVYPMIYRISYIPGGQNSKSWNLMAIHFFEWLAINRMIFSNLYHGKMVVSPCPFILHWLFQVPG